MDAVQLFVKKGTVPNNLYVHEMRGYSFLSLCKGDWIFCYYFCDEKWLSVFPTLPLFFKLFRRENYRHFIQDLPFWIPDPSRMDEGREVGEVLQR